MSLRLFSSSGLIAITLLVTGGLATAGDRGGANDAVQGTPKPIDGIDMDGDEYMYPSPNGPEPEPPHEPHEPPVPDDIKLGPENHLGRGTRPPHRDKPPIEINVWSREVEPTTPKGQPEQTDAGEGDQDTSPK